MGNANECLLLQKPTQIGVAWYHGRIRHSNLWMEAMPRSLSLPGDFFHERNEGTVTRSVPDPPVTLQKQRRKPSRAFWSNGEARLDRTRCLSASRAGVTYLGQVPLRPISFFYLGQSYLGQAYPQYSPCLCEGVAAEGRRLHTNMACARF